MKIKHVIVMLLAMIGTVYAAPPAKSPELIKKGKKAYVEFTCVTCHGNKGDGMGDAGKMLNPKPRNFAKDKFKQGDTPQAIFDSITKGIPGTMMVGFGHIPEEQRWGLTYYVLDFRKKK